MAELSKLGQQVAGIWQGWSWARRLSLIVGVLLGVAVFAALVTWGAQPSYATLMSNLSAEDAGAITERLEQDGVPFQIGGDGSTIMVPKERVHELRLRLASEGLPRSGGVGFEVFDGQGFGISRFVENLNYKRGLEGELRRTIRNIDAVKDARVHIVLPKQSLFRDQRMPATASVTVMLRPGRRLAGQQVQAMVHLLAASVEGLSPDNVTIVDSAGSILARGDGDSGAAGLRSELEYQRRVERDLEERVRQLLGRVVGLDKLDVRVSSHIDFTKREQTSELYDPDTAAVRSERVSDEQRGAQTGGAAGIPGARSNLAGRDAAAGQSPGSGGSNRRSQTRNYEISKEINHTQSSAGRLTRLSVAVLVDDVVNVDAEGGRTYEPRSEQELNRFAELVKRAVGFDARRGDQVVVESMPFAAPEVEVVEAGWDPLTLVQILWKPVIGLGMLLFLFFLVRGMRSVARQSELLSAPRTVRELEASLEGQAGSLVAGHGAAQQPALVAARSAAAADPEKAAAVLKVWLGDTR